MGAWENENPKSKERKVFNLRLNAYQSALLDHAAEVASEEEGEAVSRHSIIMEILIPELERRAGLEPSDTKGRKRW